MGLRDKHSNYFTVVWTASAFFGFAYAFVDWIKVLFQTAQDGNIVGFLFTFLMQSIWLGVNGLISSLLIFVAFVLVSFVPYLIWRGLRN
jgi:hypothetical protein